MQFLHLVVGLAVFEPLHVAGSPELRRNYDLLAKANLMQNKASMAKVSSPYGTVEAQEQHLFQLRMCNAFAHHLPLEMRRVQAPHLIEYPLPYKECHDYTLPLKKGDELAFRAGTKVVGTFVVRGLPAPGSLLLIVPHRRDADSTALSFDSHIFAQGQDAQVAMVDAFRGPGAATAAAPAASLKESTAKSAAKRVAFVRLTDADPAINATSLRQTDPKKKARKQDLRFNTVVELKPGSYQMSLGASAKSKVKLTALQRQAYVAIRVGLHGDKGNRWPEELVIFPRTVLLEAQRSATCLPREIGWGAFIVSLATALLAITS